MDRPTTRARSYRIPLPSAGAGARQSSSSSAAASSSSNVSTSSYYASPRSRAATATTSPTRSSPGSVADSSPSRRDSREPLPFPPRAIPTRVRETDGDENENENVGQTPRGRTNAGLQTPRSPSDGSTDTGSFGLLSPAGGDAASVMSAADSALDLHADIAQAVQRAVAAHNQSWQSTLQAAETEWERGREAAVATTQRVLEEKFQRDREVWAAERRELTIVKEDQLRRMGEELARAKAARDEERGKTAALAEAAEKIRAESVPLSSHRAALLGMELKLKAREKGMEDTVRSMRSSQGDAVTRASMLVRMSEDRLMVAVASRETELKDTLEKIEADFNAEMAKVKVENASALAALDAKLRKEGAEALAAEQAAHAATKASLARMRGKTLVMKALAGGASPGSTRSGAGSPRSPGEGGGFGSPSTSSEAGETFFTPQGASAPTPSTAGRKARSAWATLASATLNRKLTAGVEAGGIGATAGAAPAAPSSTDKAGSAVGLSSPASTEASSPSGGVGDAAPALELPPDEDEAGGSSSAHEEGAEHAAEEAEHEEEDREHERAMDELHSRVDSLVAEVAAAKEEASVAAAAADEANRHEAETAAELEALKVSHAEVTTKYTASQETIASLEKEIEGAREELAAFDAIIATQKAEIARMIGEAAVAQKEIEELRPVAAQGKVDFEQATQLRQQLAIALLALAADDDAQMVDGSLSMVGSTSSVIDALREAIGKAEASSSTSSGAMDALVQQSAGAAGATFKPMVQRVGGRAGEGAAGASEVDIPSGGADVAEYASGRAPSYLAVLEAIKEMHVLGREVKVEEAAPAAVAVVEGGAVGDDKEASTVAAAGGDDNFSDDEDDDEEEEKKAGSAINNNAGAAAKKAPSAASSAAFSFVNAMLNAAADLANRSSTLDVGALPSGSSSGAADADAAVARAAADALLASTLPIQAVLVPKPVDFAPLIAVLIRRRYGGLLTLLRAEAEDGASASASTSSTLLPSARAVVSFLSVLAEADGAPSAAVNLLHAALDAHSRGAVAGNVPVVATPVSAPASSISSTSSSSATAGTLWKEERAFDADLAQEMMATSDLWREAAVAAERRHASALADAALVREAAGVAVAQAESYVRARDTSILQAQQALSETGDRASALAQGVASAGKAVSLLVAELESVRGARASDREVYAALRDDLLRTDASLVAGLMNLQAELEALVAFENARAPHLIRAGSVVGSSSALSVVPGSPRLPVSAASPLSSFAAVGGVMTGAVGAAARARAAVAAKQAAAAEKERSAAAAAASAATAAAAPPLPSSPAGAWITGEGNAATGSTPRSAFVAPPPTPAPPTPSAVRGALFPGYGGSTDVFPLPIAFPPSASASSPSASSSSPPPQRYATSSPTVSQNYTRSRPEDVQDAIQATSADIRMRGDLLASAGLAGSIGGGASGRGAGAAAALAAFTARSPQNNGYSSASSSYYSAPTISALPLKLGSPMAGMNSARGVGGTPGRAPPPRPL